MTFVSLKKLFRSMMLDKAKLSKKPNKEEHEVDNEIVSIDGIIVGPRNSLTTPKPPVPSAFT